MPRQGLNKETVIAAAVHLIEEKGASLFSMNELAKRLNIKPASLYNHVESMDALLTEVGLLAVEQMIAIEKEAIRGKVQDDALFALADAYRNYAENHYELYLIVMNIPKTNNRILDQAAEKIMEPIMSALSEYGLGTEEQMHWQRILRSMMHGFVAHEQAGAFSHFPISRDKSYEIAIHAISDSLHYIGGA